ncbi:glutamine and serine-rich protein 1 isoform X2 [Carcharodon carcharias]|uniref:glutamine and serine-rich protein 1 isoform X2 n=1 Tax=Carcharodon carcharias TaxID=13397 RepID=UPI001B7EBC4F|nr:glutamine and serine-rich protein 1 isoform X2 [Carcharodon carcharias]
MDRNYPTPNFSDQLAPGGQTWPYERAGSGVKSSLSYGAAHPETDLLHRPAYAASHQLPGYTTTHHPTGLSSLFDATMQHSGSGASETSVMNFLSAIESRTPQAGPAAASLLPQFRAPSWQTGMHSSTPTELFVTGALQASGTFPPSALAAYQHPSTFTSRSFTGAQSLTLQDAPFSPTTNGLISPHDPLLQIKSSQAAVPSPLTFDRIGSTVLSTSIPPSSTYRSAQESAPHHLQPQFSLLPSALGPAQQASQAYGTSVFSSSTASIERALQRECSVIKHHQRPSSSHSVQGQLPSSHHSLQGYLTSGSGVDFQETSRHAGLTCSPLGDQSQVSNGGTQQKSSAVTVEQSQSYSSTIQSPDYSSKAKNCSRSAQRSTKTAKSQSATATVQTQSYSTPTQKQSSVISSQSQVYSSGQASNLIMSISQSQNYVSTQSQNISAVSHSEVYSSSQPEKLTTLNKSPASYSGQSQNLTPVSQALSYSSDQPQVLPSVSHTDNYSSQPQNLSSISQTQSYPSGHSQGLPAVSQSQSSYSAQSQGLSTVSLSPSYASGQSLTLTSHTQSLPFSSSTRAQNLSSSSPTQNFMSLHSSPTSQPQSVPSPQSQKFLSGVHSPTFSSSSHSQTMQNTQSSTDRKQSYIKRKSDSDLFVPSKEDDESFPIQDLLQQQSSLDASTPGITESGIGEENAVYAVSKADDRYLSQSVIRSNSRLEDQVVGLTLQGSKTGERKHERVKQFNVTRSIEAMVTHHGQPVGSNNNMNTHDMKKVANPSQSSHIIMGAEELKQPHSLLHKAQETRPQAHQAQVINTSQHLQTHAVCQTPRLQLSGAQVLLDSSREMPLSLIQQSVAQQPQLLQSGLGQSQASAQSQQIQAQSQASHHQSQFLQLERHIAQANAPQSQQQLLQQNSEAMKLDGTESSKPLQLTTKDHFDPSHRQDSKSQFVGLSSVCFSESMLLGVERNLFSGVEDVFSANEECGVTPQEFAKSTCNESSIRPVECADGSKSTFQTVSVRHVSPSFHTSQTVLPDQPNMHNLTLSNSQINLDLGAVPLDGSAQSKTSSLDQQTLGTSDQHLQPGLPAQNLNSIQDSSDQGIEDIKKHLSANPESEEEDNDDIPDDGAINNAKDPDFIPSGRSNTDESAVSDIDYSLGDEITPGSGNKRKLKRPVKPKLKLGLQADGWSHSLPEEEGNLDLALDGNQKKRRAKVRSKETLDDELCSQKPIKRSGQGKRLNSKDANSPHTSNDSYYESYHQQERINQKIREVEEKQPEVKSGFIASFLDFLKSGPKQQFPAPSVRMAHRNRRPSANTIHTPLLPPVSTHQSVPTALISAESESTSPCKKLDDDMKKNLETLPAFSSDEEDSVGRNQDLQKSISSALSVLDDPSNKKEKWNKKEFITNGEKDSNSSVPAVIQQEKVANPSPPLKEEVQEPTEALESPEQNEQDDLNPTERAAKQELLAVEGSTDEDDIESGGEGMYRERDEFVVKIEDIKALKVALNTGREPPAIWKVQKALLQKFMPEVKDGRRQFSATNSYLGYFGDAKTKYKRVYVKFIENVNKKDYVRVCSKKPRNRPLQTLRHNQSRMGSSNKVSASNSAASKGSTAKSKARPVKQVKQLKVKAEPPPKKRKKWLKEEYSSHSDSSLETQSDDEDERPLTTPYVARFLNTRTMKETFKNYMELLVSTALDPDMIEASEQSNDEMYLPHMRKIDSMLNENKKRMISKFPLEPALKTALENFPELTTCASGAKGSNSNMSKIKLSGKNYNKKTLQSLKQNAKGQKEFTVDQEKLQCCTLYHTLHHHKYHTYLICKKEAASILKQNKDLGQVETIQQCMENEKWVEDLFEKFGDVLTQAQQKCS